MNDQVRQLAVGDLSMKIIRLERKVNEIAALALAGLHIDELPQKQYTLERILEKCGKKEPRTWRTYD